MAKFIVKRILMTILVVVGAAVVIFTIMYFIPGDPAELLSSANATPADIARKREELGLADPYLIQLGKFLYNTFIKFDLGTSWFRGTSVMSGIVERLPRTLLLGTLTVLLTVIVGIPVGIKAAISRGKLLDRILVTSTMFFISVPEFWLALMLVMLFAYHLGILPAFGISSWKCFIMPIIAGGLSSVSTLARQTRSSVLEVINADFITTARAKGLKENEIIYKHMLPNAMIPIITVVGGQFARCVGGTVVIEKIFSFPGIGLYLSDAITMRDYPIVRGCVVMLAIFTAVLMLVVDLAYGFADPQIKAQYINSNKRKGAKAVKHRHHGGRGGHGHGRGGRRFPGAPEGDAAVEKAVQEGQA